MSQEFGDCVRWPFPAEQIVAVLGCLIFFGVHRSVRVPRILKLGCLVVQVDPRYAARLQAIRKRWHKLNVGPSSEAERGFILGSESWGPHMLVKVPHPRLLLSCVGSCWPLCSQEFVSTILQQVICAYG